MEKSFNNQEIDDSIRSFDELHQQRSTLKNLMGKIAMKLSETRLMKFINEPWLTIEFPHGDDPLREAEIIRIIEAQKQSSQGAKRANNGQSH